MNIIKKTSIQYLLKYFNTFLIMNQIPSSEQIDENIRSLENGTSLTQIEKDAISIILQTSREIGPNISVRIVGGWVRDKILGIDSQDIDLAVENVTGDEFGKKLQSHFPQNISKYQTIVEYEGQPSVLWVAKAVIFDNFDIDICRLRTDEFPDVPPSEEQGTPYQDSIGRDFTINSLFFNLNTMKVEDFSNGINDIKNGVLRAGVDPMRGFCVELQRIIRAFRFSINFPFKMDDRIRQTIPKLKERFIQRAPMDACSKQMVRALLNAEDACKIIDEMNELNFFNAFFDQNNELNIDVEKAKHRIKNLNIENQNASHILAEIYRDSFKKNSEKTSEVIKKLKLAHQIEKEVFDCISNESS